MTIPFFYPLVAHAGNSYDIFGGGESDNRGQSSSSLGVVAGRTLDERFSITGGVLKEGLKYRFESGGRTLNAEYPIIIIPSVGLKYQKDRYVITGSAGFDYREVKKDLPGGGDKTVSKNGASFQAGAYLSLADKRSASVLADFSTIDNFFRLSGSGKQAVYAIGDTGINLGGELSVMGNRDFTSVGEGAILEASNKPYHLSVLLRAGLRQASAIQAGYYTGIDISLGLD